MGIGGVSNLCAQFQHRISVDAGHVVPICCQSGIVHSGAMRTACVLSSAFLFFTMTIDPHDGMQFPYSVCLSAIQITNKNTNYKKTFA
jgi:hypothetical protein